MTDLEPCPFCGGEASETIGSIRYSDRHEAWWPDGTQIRDAYFVNCLKCGCDNKAMLGHQTEDAAIAAWNTRAPSSAARERDAMREALTRLASSEAFDLPQVIDGPLAKEMRMRMDFARQALNQEQPA